VPSPAHCRILPHLHNEVLGSSLKVLLNCAVQWKEALQRWLDVAPAAVRVIFSGRDADDLEVRPGGPAVKFSSTSVGSNGRRHACGACCGARGTSLGFSFPFSIALRVLRLAVSVHQQ
jgi:hypothetical protein